METTTNSYINPDQKKIFLKILVWFQLANKEHPSDLALSY